jgi:hypothetical protein
MKVVIIAQHIFPRPTPRASRATELAKEFAKQGHHVTLYAVLGKYDYSAFEKEYNITIKHIPLNFEFHTYSSDIDHKRVFFDKVLGKLFGKIFEFPYIEFYFKIPSIIQKENDADLIISIGAPHQIHWGLAKAKMQLGSKFKAVWIADCGDPFMKNYKNQEHFRFYGKFEHLFCSLADFISVPVTSAIEDYFPEYKNKFVVIPQGFSFDLKLLEKEIAKNSTNKKLNFCYAGLLNENYRNPKSFLDILCKSDADFTFTVYSADLKLIAEYQDVLGEKLLLKKPIPRSKLLEELEKMDFLVNIENKDLPGQVPSKLIDYAILRKPILNIKPENPDEKIIIEFLNGNFSNSYNVENIENYHISNIYNNFIQLYELKRVGNNI